MAAGTSGSSRFRVPRRARRSSGRRRPRTIPPSRPTAGGWRTSRTRPAAAKSMFVRSPCLEQAKSPSPPKAARGRCGRAMAANSITGPPAEPLSPSKRSGLRRPPLRVGVPQRHRRGSLRLNKLRHGVRRVGGPLAAHERLHGRRRAARPRDYRRSELAGGTGATRAGEMTLKAALPPPRMCSDG